MVNLSASTASIVEVVRTHLAPALPYHEHLTRRVAHARRVIQIAWLLVLLSVLSHRLKASRATVQRDLQALHLHGEAGQWTPSLAPTEPAPVSHNGLGH